MNSNHIPNFHFKNAFLPISLFLILLFTAYLFWPGLYGDLILDDLPNLKWLLPLAQGETTLSETLLELNINLSSRPVAMLSFIFNFWFTGSDIWSLKFTNLSIHLICGCLVFLLSHRLLMQPVAGINEKARTWIALWIAAAWLLVPIQVSTVLYVIQRMAQLPALFVIAGLLSFVIGRQIFESQKTRGFILIVMAFALFWPLATFSKENGAIFPLLVLLIELFFFGGWKRRYGIDRKILRSLIVLIIAVFLAFVTKFLLQPDWVLQGYTWREFTLYERLLTQPRILFDYIANMLLIPGGSGMGLFHDDFMKSTGILSPVTTILSIIVVITTIVAGFIKINSRSGLILFGPVFYLAAHLIESSIFPLELYFEHRNYLPSFGILFSTGLGFYYLLTQVRVKKTMIVLLCSILAVYSFFTFYRVDLWKSWDSILLASESGHPESLRVQRGLAIVYIFRGEIYKAIEHLEKADKLDSPAGDFGVALKYIIAHCYADRIPDEVVYDRLDRLRNITNDYYTRTVFLWFVDSVESGICKSVEVKRVINILQIHLNEYLNKSKNINDWEFYIYISRLLASQGEYEDALFYLNKALIIKPGSKTLNTLMDAYLSEIK